MIFNQQYLWMALLKFRLGLKKTVFIQTHVTPWFPFLIIKMWNYIFFYFDLPYQELDQIHPGLVGVGDGLVHGKADQSHTNPEEGQEHPVLAHPSSSVAPDDSCDSAGPEVGRAPPPAAAVPGY